MFGSEKYWQTTRPSICKRMKFVLNNELFSDVKFVVRDSDSGSKDVIPAHKFILSIGSPVFEAMFYGELAETRDSIELPDCEYESLLELFRYMYSDEVNLSGSNVMGVLYLAKKYMVPSLAEKCTEYLQDHLDPSNVFSVLPSAQKYEENGLVDQCWKVIDEQTDAAVKSARFGTIERSLLEAVVTRDNLAIAEVELFKAVDLWASMECERQGLSTGGELKRRVLGEHIIRGIRFPTMEQGEFASVVLDSGILTKEEIIQLVKRFTSVSKFTGQFSATERSGPQRDVVLRCCRFGSVSELEYAGSNHHISFQVDNNILLRGLCLFGSRNIKSKVQLKIMETNSQLVLVSKSGEFSSSSYESQDFSYYGFQFLFDKPVLICKNSSYHMEARIVGTGTRGESGMPSVTCSGVKFSFMACSCLSNSTDVNRGQFPELLFSCCFFNL